MKGPRHRCFRTSAFSLSEVTISMGIVVVLMLPVLAMLGGGGSMEVLSRDRETASRIVRTLVTGTRGGKGGGHYQVHFPGEEVLRIDSPGGGAEKKVFLLFDEAGRFLGELDEGDYRGGVDPAEGGRYIVRIRLSGGVGGGAEDTTNGLESWDVSVERPAAAARDARESELFQTRFAAP